MDVNCVFGFAVKKLSAFLIALCVTVASIVIPATADENALLAVDTSSPRATLATLQMLTAALEEVVIKQEMTPTADGQAEIFRLMQKLTSLLDLSAIPPASRRDMARDTVAFLVDVIRRLDVPPLASIPDAEKYPDVTKPASWTIPGSEVTISRVLTDREPAISCSIPILSHARANSIQS